MSTAYCTPITRKQVNVLYRAACNDQIHLSKSMIDYLYFYARQGNGYVSNPHEEDFRSRIREAVIAVISGKYEIAENDLFDAFHLACACWESELLKTIESDMEKSQR